MLGIIKYRIKQLFETNPYIHVSVNLSRPKVYVTDSPAVITGVYPNFFRIEESEGGCTRFHSIQYTDVMFGQVKIKELKI